jgi:translation initiation factor IF-3
MGDYGKISLIPLTGIVFVLSYSDRIRRRKLAISNKDEYRINKQIRATQIRLIDEDGENIGVVSLREGLTRAEDAGLDLVEVAPNADPPVVRVMNFSKFLYEKEKKEREARKSQTKIEIKEIRLRPKTTEHHRGFKVRDARRWLGDGMKVRVTIRFRGREITYPEIALEDLREIAEELSDVSEVEQAPKLEGRSMFMMLAPNK